MPISTSYIGLIMETGMWPANQRIKYSIMMLYHNIMNGDHKRVARKIIAEQAKMQPQEHHDFKSKTNSTRNRT